MSQRLDRVNELLRREISTVLQRDFEFGGSLVTVNGVEITQDLREAKVFVGVLGGHASKVLEQGQTLGMFPEGTRNKSRGLGVAKTGTARMAIETESQIVPMVLIGTDGFFKGFPHRASVTVKLLPPLQPYPGETPLALTDRLMFSMAAELPKEMRGVYAEIPKGFES